MIPKENFGLVVTRHFQNFQETKARYQYGDEYEVMCHTDTCILQFNIHDPNIIHHIQLQTDLLSDQVWHRVGYCNWGSSFEGHIQ
jgi:hypothetical protein